MQEVERAENSVTFISGNCKIKFLTGHLDKSPEGRKKAKEKMFKDVTEVYMRNAEYIIKAYNEELKEKGTL